MGAQGTHESEQTPQLASRDLAEGTVPWESWQELMEACTSVGVVYAVRGDRAASGSQQQLGDERPRVSWGQSSFGERFAASCCRGKKGTPNQDNFFFLELAGGDFVLGVMDGHGEWGHKYSELIAWWMPVLVVRSPDFATDVPDALMNAFEAMSELLAKQVSSRVSAEQMSGSTCIVVVGKGSSLYVAYLGDSRVIVYGPRISHALTEDHKPNKLIESTRISQQGGRVELDSSGGPRLMDSSGHVGLAMSRAFGDTKVQDLGLSEVPDLKIYPLDVGTTYCLVAGSDGVWDYMTAQEVRQHAWSEDGSCEAAVSTRNIGLQARQRWFQHSRGSYVDDITCVMLQFTCSDICRDRSRDAVVGASASTGSTAVPKQAGNGLAPTEIDLSNDPHAETIEQRADVDAGSACIGVPNADDMESRSGEQHRAHGLPVVENTEHDASDQSSEAREAATDAAEPARDSSPARAVAEIESSSAESSAAQSSSTPTGMSAHARVRDSPTHALALSAHTNIEIVPGDGL